MDLMSKFIMSFFKFYRNYYSLRIFNTSVNWWSFIGVWVTASLHWSPGEFWLSIFVDLNHAYYLDSLESPNNFQFLQAFLQAFWDRS